MASDVPQGSLQCHFCDMNSRDRGNLVKHERHCKNNPDAHIRTESPGNAQKRTARIPVLPEQCVKNPVSDYSHGGINDDLPKVPLTLMEKLAATILCTLKTRGSRRATCSDDEPGTSNSDDGAAANNPDQVLTTCSDKSSSSVEYYGGDEVRRVSASPIVGMEEDDLNQNVGRQGVTNCVDDSDVIQKQEQKPDLSDLVVIKQQNMKTGTNIPEHRDSSVMQMQNEKLGLNLLPCNDSSGQEVPTLSVSSTDVLNALVPNDTDSDEETETVNEMASDVPQGYLQCHFCGTNFKRRSYEKHQQHCKYNPDALKRQNLSASSIPTSARRARHSEMASDGPQENCQCSFCHKDFEGRRSCAEHELQCKNNPEVHSQTEPSGNAQGGIGILGVHVPRKKRTARNQPLPEQHLKKPASDYARRGTSDAPETPPKPTTSEVKVDSAINAPDINIPEHKDPSVMQKQKKKLDLNLQPHSDSSDKEGQADSFSSIDDLSTIDTNSDKQKKAITGGATADTNIPEHKDPSATQMQNELDLNLPPHNDSFSSMDDLNALVTADTNSDKEKKTDNAGVDISIPDHKDPSVTQMQNNLDLNLPPHDNSFSSMDDLNALVPADTNSDKEKKTDNGGIPADANSDKEKRTDNCSVPTGTNSVKEKKTDNGGVDTNIPDHRDPSAMQMKNKLDLNLPPLNDEMTSEWDSPCQFCGKNFKRRGNLLNHELNCKYIPDAHTQTESPGNAQGRKDILGFHIPKEKRTVPAFPASDHAQGGINGETISEVKADRDPEEETDVLEALLLLKEQPAYPGEDTFSDDEPGAGNLDDEPAASNPDQVLTTCSDKISSSVECYGGDERRVGARAIAGVEEDDLNRNVGCQGVTGCVDDSDLQKQKRKPDLSVADLRDLVEMQQQNVKADINIRDREHPSVMKIQNEKVDLNLLPHKNRSDHEVPTLSVSSVDDPDALVSADTNSDKEIETVNSGIDINIPEQRESSVMQMQKEKLGLNLPPRNDSSGHEVPTLSVSSTDDLTSLAPTDTISDKDTNSNVADSFIHCPEQE
uniref:C2H2-type domain-containing protein n=1 Tax=Oryza punctata TaxID=4537 RepID=A0A0E0MNZ8_ORYPU